MVNKSKLLTERIWLTMGCHLLLIDKASGLGWSLNNPCSFIILGLNLACLGDQPQKVSCCRLSLLVLFLLGLKLWLFSLAAGLKEVDEVELLRFLTWLKSLLTSTSMSWMPMGFEFNVFKTKTRASVMRKISYGAKSSHTSILRGFSCISRPSCPCTAGKSTLWCSTVDWAS